MDQRHEGAGIDDLSRRQTVQVISMDDISLLRVLPCGLVNLSWQGGTAPYTLVGTWYPVEYWQNRDPALGRRCPIAVGVLEHSYNWTASVPVHSTVFIDIIDSGSKELRSSIQRYFSISTPTGLYYDSDWCLEYDPIPMNAPLGLDKISPAPVATFQTASTPSNATAPPPSSSSSSSSNPLAETGGRKTEGAVIGLAAVTGVLALALLLAMRCHFRLRKGLRIAEKDRQTVTKAFPSQTRLGAPSMENPVLSRQQSFRAFNAKPAADFELFESPSSRWYTPDLFLRTKTSVTRLAGIQSGNHGPVMVSSRSEPDGETGEHLSMIDDQYSVLEPDQFPMPVLAPRHHQQVHTPVSHGSPLHSPDISSRSFAFSSRKAGPVPTITSGTSGTGISDDHYHRKKARSSPFFRWKYQA